MTTDKFQSHIAEVRDQISLDFSDDLHLNAVSANLGMIRPSLGFTDDTWRAVVKVLALQPKQVETRFAAILAVIFGPQKTVTGTLTAQAAAGTSTLTLNDTSAFPQIGTLILDEGTTAQETLTYCYIDRTNNVVYLDSKLSTTHRANEEDFCANILFAPAGESFVIVDTLLPIDPGLAPFTFVLGKGTDTEETVAATSIDVVGRRLNLNTTLVNDHTDLVVSPTQTTLSNDYVSNTTILYVNDLTNFPEEGMVRISTSDVLNVTGAASTDELVYSSALFEDGAVVGDVLVFEATTTTGALQSLARTVINVEDKVSYSILTLDNALPIAPSGTDTFTIDKRVKYTSTSVDSNVIFLESAITGLGFTAGATVEVVSTQQTACLGPVKSQGAGWDIIQSNPRCLELYIPEEALQNEGTLRNASYLHGIQTGASTTLSSDFTTGDPTMAVTSTAGFPLVGTATSSGDFFTFHVTSPTELTIVSPGTIASQLSGASIVMYEPVHGGTLLSGDIWTTGNVFAGPYLYNPGVAAPTALVATTTTDMLSTPGTKIRTTATNTSEVVEVEDASKFPLSGFPYNVVVGAGLGNAETLRVLGVNLKVRTLTTMASDALSPASTFTVTSASLGANAEFPNNFRYRVRIGRGTANEEVLMVTSVAANVLTISGTSLSDHLGGELVELESDILVVDALDEVHNGLIVQGEWLENHPSIDNAARLQQETVALPISELSVVDTTGFPAEGNVILNFGNELIPVEQGMTSALLAGATILPMGTSTAYPVTYPFTVKIGPGTALEEIHHITTNSLVSLTLNNAAFGLKYDQPIGTIVQFVPGTPEVIEYDSIVGNTIRFSSPIVLQSDHQTGESVIASTTTSDPISTGYDFPFRLPVDIRTRVEFLFDLIRAAGVEVKIIEAK